MVREKEKGTRATSLFELSSLVWIDLACLSLDGTRAFLHFVFRKFKGGACLHLREFEAEKSQCVDVILCMWVEGLLNCFNATS